MLPGPVFEAEMRAMARRGRHYASRAGYGVMLLMILAQGFYLWTARYPGPQTVAQMAGLAQVLFYSVVVFQILAVIVATPSMVAGSLAEERQRKTLDYLLASRLSGAEIVVGKLAARLAWMGVSLLVSAPVLALLSLLGGIDPRLNLLMLGATLSTMLLLASWSVWVSSVSRRPRDAVSASYSLVALWFLFPVVLRLGWTSSLPWWALAPLSWLGELLNATSPMGLLTQWRQVVTAGGGALVGPALGMIAWQLPLSLGFAALASWRLRPFSRRSDGTQPVAWFRRSAPSRRVQSRRSCGDRPMLWKELRTERRGGVARFLERAAMMGVAGLVLYGAARILLQLGPGAGWGGPGWWGHVYSIYNEYLTIVSPLLSVVLIFQVLVVAAGSVTGEREADTWTGLTATTLSAREVVGAKVVGALWRGRGVAALILLIWTLGLPFDALDWRVMLVAVLELAVFTTFAACFGVLLSLALPTTHRSQVFGFGLLLLLNITGQAALGLWHSARQSFAPGWFPGCMPAALGRTLSMRGPAYWLVNRLGGTFVSEWNGGLAYSDPVEHLIVGLGGLIFYAVAAYAAWRIALHRFDVVAGRPKRRATASVPVPAALDPIATSA